MNGGQIISIVNKYLLKIKMMKEETNLLKIHAYKFNMLTLDQKEQVQFFIYFNSPKTYETVNE